MIPNYFNKLLVAIDTISASNADHERWFRPMNSITTDNRNMTTTYSAANLFFINTVGLASERWDPQP